jgi:hypothetical protein
MNTIEELIAKSNDDTFGLASTSKKGLMPKQPMTTTNQILITPALGTPASGVLTNCTGYPANTHRNAIINGCGLINQRVTAYTLVKNAYGIGADRFYGMATGTAVSAGTFNNIATANCGVTGYAFKFIAVTLTGTGVIYFRHRIEAKDSIRFKNQTAIFSCKVYQDTGGAVNYTTYVRKANSADTFSAVTAIGNSGAVSVPNTTATALSYSVAMGDCSNGIEIEIKVECGAITTKNFEFTECQLELGAVVTPFEFRLFTQELNLCMRYYERMTISGVYGNFGFGNVEGTNSFYSQVPYNIKKRIPTVTPTYSGSFASYVGGTLTALTATTTQGSVTDRFLCLKFTGDSTNGLKLLYANNDAAAWLAAECEL